MSTVLPMGGVLFEGGGVEQPVNKKIAIPNRATASIVRNRCVLGVFMRASFQFVCDEKLFSTYGD